MTDRKIEVDCLARVEGEGRLVARVRDGVVEHVELNIFEPPRHFEALLRGRDFREAPDITARICGICPVAYQMSAVQAMEAACGVTLPAPLRRLRRLLYCGEWIQSHVLHVFMLHLPDFLGYDGAVEMARDHAVLVARGLRIKRAGNAIIAAVGGREVHPVNVRVGGFYRAPARAELLALTDELAWARDAAYATLRWAGALEFPAFERDYLFVALRGDDGYPMNEGRIVSSRGLDIAASGFEAAFEETQVAHSTALHARTVDGEPYLVGPLARYALNHDHLPAAIRDAARDAGLGPVCRNPFRSLLVRLVEVIYALDEALALVDAYAPPAAAFVDVVPRDGRGRWATEAPRGLLYHRYDIGADGAIRSARIVPPTSQNQPSIEDDVRDVVSASLALDDDALRARAEQAVRNYDPCISCATHFLKLDITRLAGGR